MLNDLKKVSVIIKWVTLLIFIGLVMVNTAWTKQDNNYQTGLPELTQEELEYQNKHMFRVKKVKLNKLGLERINNWRKTQGKEKIDDEKINIKKKGSELELAVGETVFTDADFSVPTADIPADIDNSQLMYFPPIRSQGSINSCGAFSGVYYAMTYMHAWANNLDAQNGGDTARLSPKWAYNMVNGGANAGSWYYWAYEIGQKHGAATWSEFPYDSNYREWCSDTGVWEDALYRRFDQYGYVSGTSTDAGIEQVKQMLLNGYVLNIPTYIHSWNWKAAGDDPSTTADDGYAGKSIAYWVNGTSGYHAMTVVGFNDDIWVDINGNGTVDTGEKGAFRIANSWGTGWGEGGFCWMSYDALKSSSGVANGPASGRISGWYPDRAHWVTAREGYTPKVIGKFTLTHSKRDHLRITLGVSDTGDNLPGTVWYPEMIYNQGGAYGFDGTTTAVTRTFVFDFTDILPTANATQRYYLGMNDDSAGDQAFMASFVLVDLENSGQETVCLDTPLSVDAGQIYAPVDYYRFDGNLPPVAVMTTSDTQGMAPFEISFDGSESYDEDGHIASYEWNFGDGSSQSGPVVTHTYDTAGSFTATLTVTDDSGASHTDQVSVEIQAAPLTACYVLDMEGQLFTSGPKTGAETVITIVDEALMPVANAQVQGNWTGVVTGTATGTTAGDGTVTLRSRTTKKDGTFTFTITQVSASGYEYDPPQNLVASITLPEDEPVNQAPVAVIETDVTSGTAPLVVDFSGLSSYDPDGDIVNFVWDFGDTWDSSDPSGTHTYDLPGIYEMILTVMDDAGATDEQSITIQVDTGDETIMVVNDITMDIQSDNKWKYALASILVLDETGFPVADAVVSGTWTGIVKEDTTMTAGSNGSVLFVSPRTKRSGTATFTVQSVAAPGFVYDPGQSNETTDSIDVQ